MIDCEETRLEDFIARKIAACRSIGSLSIIHAEIGGYFVGWRLDCDAAQHLFIQLAERTTLLMRECRQDVRAEGGP